MKITYLIFCIWIVISYMMLIFNDELINEETSIIKCFGVFSIFMIGGPIFLINNILLSALELILGGEWEDDS